MRLTRRGFIGSIVAALALGPAAWRAKWTPKAEPLGLSIKFVREFDPIAVTRINRFDLTYGFAVLNPDFAVRVQDEPLTWLQRYLARFRKAA